VFRWRGTFLGLFNGEHSFIFEEKEEETEFKQEEVFSGILGWIGGEGWLARRLGVREKTRVGFEGFNRDLKDWCEIEERKEIEKTKGEEWS
jgi:hypothetical protein